MKLRLSILLLAAALAAAPAAGQTIKSLGFNTTNGQVVYSGTNPLTFTNSVGFATNARAATRTNLGATTVGDSVFTATNQTAAQAAIFGTNAEIRNSSGIVALSLSGGETKLLSPISFPYINGSAAATTSRANLGLGTTNAVTFSQLSVSNGAITNPAIQLGDSTTGFSASQSPSTIRAIAGGSVVFSLFGGGFNVTPAATFSTNVTVGGTLGVSNAATFSTNVTVNGNATLNGVGNIAPSQTASSGASLMTRDLVGQEFANPRNRMQTTYWFGLEGLGLWQTVGTGVATLSANSGGTFGPTLSFYTSTRADENASGVGLRLGSTAITGGSAWQPANNAIVLKTSLVNFFGPLFNGNRAVAFYLGNGNNTNFWGNSNAVGLFWVEQPTNSWAASTAFVARDRISVSNVVWAVSTAGTTDTNEPVWTDLINSTVTNGTAVFRNLGPHTSNNWVLAIGSTNASEVVMTNTGKSTWLAASGSAGKNVVLSIYATNTTAPYTIGASVEDASGVGAATISTSNNNTRSPQYWLRWESTLTNNSFASESVGVRYFSVDAQMPALSSP